MENRGWSLLLLVTAATTVTTSPSQHRTQSYEEAVALAVDFYNQGSGIDHAFRLLKADPQPGWDMTSNPRQKLKFTIKETACLVSENLRGTECAFRDNGVVRDCSGLFSTEPESPVIIIISCDAVSEEHARVRRSRSPRRGRRRGRPRTGSYTLIAHGGGKGKGKGSGTRIA